MSEFKGTPGPWEHSTILSASENHKGYNIWQPVDGGRHGSFVAEVSPRDQDGIEGEANARLIAAAPDLLEALQTAPAFPQSAVFDAWWDNVAAPAIKKALGDE